MRTPRRTTIALVSGVSAVAALTSCSSGAASPDTADEAAEQPSEAAVVRELFERLHAGHSLRSVEREKQAASSEPVHETRLKMLV